MATESHSTSETPRPATIVRKTLLVGAVVALALLVWQLADVILLGFAAVLFAIMLRSLSGLIEQHTPVGTPWSLVLSGLLIAAVVATFLFLLGTEIRSQVSELVARGPQMISSLGDRLGVENLQEKVVDQARDLAGRSGLLGRFAGYTTSAVAILANILPVIAAGIYLAARPAHSRQAQTDPLVNKTG